MTNTNSFDDGRLYGILLGWMDTNQMLLQQVGMSRRTGKIIPLIDIEAARERYYCLYNRCRILIAKNYFNKKELLRKGVRELDDKLNGFEAVFKLLAA